MGHLETIILKTTTMFKLVKVSFIKSLEKTNKSLVKEIERLTDKYIPKHAKDGKFTGKNN